MTAIVLPYPVSGNRYWRHVRTPARTLVVLSDEAKAYRRAVQQRCMTERLRPLAGDVELWITLHPRLTRSGAASRTRLDLDNVLKVSLDALQGSLYVSDSQVTRLHAEIGAPMADGGLSVRAAPTHAQD